MQVVRNYVKRETDKSTWSGEIGRVMLETDATEIKLNGTKVPLASMEYLLGFALQSLQDAYAGATSLDEAKGNWAKKLEAIVNGTLGQRSGGGAVSDEVRIGRTIIREILRKSLAKEVYEAKYKDDDDAVDIVREKNAAKIKDELDRRLEVLRVERAAKAKLAKSSGELEL